MKSRKTDWASVVGKYLFIFFTLFFGFVTSSFAVPGADVIPEGQSDEPLVTSDNVPYLRENRGLRVQWNMNCYGVNLRASHSVLSSSATLEMKFTVNGFDPVGISITAADAFDGANGKSVQYTGALAGTDQKDDGDEAENPLVHTYVRAKQSVVTAFLRSFLVSYRSVDSLGQLTNIENPIQFESPPSFTQSGISSSGSIRNYASSPQYRVTDPFGGEMEINSSFVGERGYCGSYISPLMLFFDNKRPKFTGRSEYPLDKFKRQIYWVEKNSPGYFLALDRNGDGRISEPNELFGNADRKNGFEALRALDSNLDHQINKEDVQFANLLLWNDANGDGVSQKGELRKLSKERVISLSLDYTKGRLKRWGNRASAREFASFTFKDAKGKVRKGTNIDIWFEPASPAVAKSGFNPSSIVGGPSIFDSLHTPLGHSR